MQDYLDLCKDKMGVSRDFLTNNRHFLLIK